MSAPSWVIILLSSRLPELIGIAVGARLTSNLVHNHLAGTSEENIGRVPECLGTLFP